MLTFIVLYFQNILRNSAIGTALRLVALTGAIFLTAGIAGRLTSKPPTQLAEPAPAPDEIAIAVVTFSIDRRKRSNGPAGGLAKTSMGASCASSQTGAAQPDGSGPAVD